MLNSGMSALHRQNKSQQYSLQAGDHGTVVSQYVTLLVTENISDREPALAAAVSRAPSAASVSRGSSSDTSCLAICSVSSLNTKCSELCSLVAAKLEN